MTDFDMMSLEGSSRPIEKADIVGEKIMSIVDRTRSSFKKISLTEKKLILWCNKRYNLAFYKKYLGRLESGAWDRYASEAEVKENKMLGDPVTILKGDAQEYLYFLAEKMEALYSQIMKIGSAIVDENVKLEKIYGMIDKYASEKLNMNFRNTEEHGKKDEYWFKLKRATSTRIADAIFWDGKRKIYGYTPEVVAFKRLPPPNHTIVTLIVANPEEQPVMQSVTDIFESYESFKIMAASDKSDVFKVFKEINYATLAAVDTKKINEFNNVISKFKSKAKDSDKDSDDDDDSEESGEKKIRKKLLKAARKSLKMIVGMKAYTMDCVIIYYQMLLRIDNLARKSIEAILTVENKYKDERYRPGLAYVNDDKTYNAKIERQKRRNDLKNTAKALNKGRY